MSNEVCRNICDCEQLGTSAVEAEPFKFRHKFPSVPPVEAAKSVAQMFAVRVLLHVTGNQSNKSAFCTARLHSRDTEAAAI
jgi:hypothetical protein